MKEKYPVITSIGISIGTIIIMLLLTAVFSFIEINSEVMQLIWYSTIPMLLAVFLFPMVCAKILHINVKYENDNIKNMMISFFVFIFFSISFYLITNGKNMNDAFLIATILHYGVLGISEEFLSRAVIIKILTIRYNSIICVIVSAIIFAFVLHNNEPFLTNLFIRVPMGLLFGFITVKSKCIYYSMVFHAIYDLLVL